MTVYEFVGVTALDASNTKYLDLLHSDLLQRASEKQQAMENDEFFPRTHFRIELMKLAENRASYTIQQLITALEATTTLTELSVDGNRRRREPPPLSIRRVLVEPICQCLANLRLLNEHHPLQEVDFYNVHPDVVRPFLVAFKQFGIHKMIFSHLERFPIHFLLDFCRDNSNLKVLHLSEMKLTDGGAAVALPPSDYPNGDSSTLNLDMLLLDQIKFETSIAENNFAHFVAQLSVSALVLGGLQDEEYYAFKMPAVEQLTLWPECEPKSWEAALDAGMATVIRLTVVFELYREDGDTTEKLKSLTRMIRGAVKLNSLTIYNDSSRNPLRLPRQFFQALEACSTVTEIHGNHHDGDRPLFTASEVRQLRRITARNSELGQFLANPSIFPNNKVLTLMRQFNNCPTGLYVLTRRLPEIFSFEMGNSLFPLIVEPNPTRNLRKRRKISYKY